jgi:hypothetical protein
MMAEEIDIQGTVRLGWLVQQVTSQLSSDELLDFVKELDLRVADYDFTKSLRDYCVEAVKAEDAAEPPSCA